MKGRILLLTLAVLTCLLLVTLPGHAQGEDWPRAGYDTGRTGAILFDGPQTNDTAFQIQLPGTPIGQQTVLVDGAAYIVTADADGFGFDGDTTGLDTDALWRIDLDTGETGKVLDVPRGTSPDLLTPDLLITQDLDAGELVALEIPSGEERWRAAALDDVSVGSRDYSEALATGDRVYSAFRAGDPGPAAVYGVMAIDQATGEVLWEWIRTSREPNDDEPEEQQVLDATGGPDRWPQFSGLAADDDRVYAYLRMVGPGDTRSQYEVWGIDIDTQDTWVREDTEQPSVLGGRIAVGTAPVVTERGLFIRLDAFEGLNLATGENLWTSPAGRSDQVEIQGATSMGARDDLFIGTSPQSAYRLNAITSDLEWVKSNPDTSRGHGSAPVTLDEDTAYIPVMHNRTGISGPGIDARDLDTGELRWSWKHLPTVGHDPDQGTQNTIPNWPAFGPGVAVWGAKDGTVTVIGETSASLGAPDVEPKMYPKLEEEVTLDLSSTQPGAFGEATRYMVDWGDGTVTGWQEDPTFTHAYEEEETFQAQAYAANDAQQTNSNPVTMLVGEEEPTWLSERFAEGNQDMTFGVLGIALALGGGLVTVGRRYRKRSNLQSELDALEEGFEEAKASPSECEAFLDNRKARARSLAMDGYLDEDQVGILENRAEELRGKLRVHALDEEFAFLPHGLVVKAREMVEDGDVTTLEREAFLGVLEADGMLSGRQKAIVRRRIEDWYARDTGRAPQ